MSRYKLFICLILLALATLYVLISEFPEPKTVNSPPLVTESATANDSLSGKTAGDQTDLDSTVVVEPCVPIEEFISGPDAYRLDIWFMSWGAPPAGNTEDSASAYSWYEEDVLLELSQSGDAIAKQELGRQLVISALTGVERPPANATLWDISVNSFALPLNRTIDREKLREGRDILFDAAVLGRTYALIEIAVSYALERQVHSLVGDLDKKALEELRLNSFAFGESVERLIPALHSSFFQSSVPDDLKAPAARALDDITGQVLDKRMELGINLQEIEEETTSLLNSFKICKD